MPQCAHFAQGLLTTPLVTMLCPVDIVVTVIRHNKLRDIIADLCRKAHLPVRVEAGHGMCRDNNHSRPANVLVEGWERGQPAALDIMCSHFSPHSSLPERVK